MRNCAKNVGATVATAVNMHAVDMRILIFWTYHMDVYQTQKKSMKTSIAGFTTMEIVCHLKRVWLSARRKKLTFKLEFFAFMRVVFIDSFQDINCQFIVIEQRLRQFSDAKMHPRNINHAQKMLKFKRMCKRGYLRFQSHSHETG